MIIYLTNEIVSKKNVKFERINNFISIIKHCSKSKKIIFFLKIY